MTVVRSARSLVDTNRPRSEPEKKKKKNADKPTVDRDKPDYDPKTKLHGMVSVDSDKPDCNPREDDDAQITKTSVDSNRRETEENEVAMFSSP